MSTNLICRPTTLKPREAKMGAFT